MYQRNLFTTAGGHVQLRQKNELLQIYTVWFCGEPKCGLLCGDLFCVLIGHLVFQIVTLLGA